MEASNRGEALVRLSPRDLDPEGPTGWQPRGAGKGPEPARNGCVPRPGAAREWALVCAPPQPCPSSCSGVQLHGTDANGPTLPYPGLLGSQVIDTVASANHF